MNTDLVESIKEHCPYLFELGFVLSSTNEDHRLSRAELISDDFKIEFEVLDGRLDVSIRHYYGAEHRYGSWHGLFTYLELFEGHPFEFPVGVRSAPEEMKYLSHLLLQNMNRLRAFGREGSCDDNGNKLNEIAKNITARKWKKLGR